MATGKRNIPDVQEYRDKHYLWTVDVLKKASKNPTLVRPQHLREFLATSPHAVETWPCRKALLKAAGSNREDLAHILIGAGAVLQRPEKRILEKDHSEDEDDSDSDSRPPQPVYPGQARLDGAFAYFNSFSDKRYNKLNDQLRATAESAEAVKDLVDSGAQPNYFGSYDCTSVHEAAYNGRPVCLLALLEKGGNIIARTPERRTPLHAAAIGGNKTCVDILLKAGVSVTASDYCSMTPLHFAAACARSAECVPILLEAGALVNKKDDFEMTPLHYAAASGTLEIVKLLLDKGADGAALDKWNRTPGNVVYAECETRQRKESRAAIYWLLNPEGGGDELVWDDIDEEFIWDYERPLNPVRKEWRDGLKILRKLACYGTGPLKKIKDLLSQHKSLLSTYSACKALQTCVEMDKQEVLKVFLKNGTNPNIRDSDFCTDEVFEPFVNPGYLTCGREDWPLIHIAAAAGRVQIIDTLLRYNASMKRVWVPDYPDPFGPMEAAAANGQLTVVKFLLVSGCVSDRAQLDGALRLAITPEGWEADRKTWEEAKQMRIVRTLLNAGADPNAQDVFGHQVQAGVTKVSMYKYKPV